MNRIQAIEATSAFRIRIAILLTSVILFGCSRDVSLDAPSEKMAQDFLLATVAKSTPSEVQIEGFSKTNALKRDENGVQTYDMEFKATAVFPKGIMPECIGSKYSYINHTQQEQTCYEALQRAGIGGKPFRPVGAKEAGEGVIHFEKAEKGWRATGIRMKG